MNIYNLAINWILTLIMDYIFYCGSLCCVENYNVFLPVVLELSTFFVLCFPSF